MYIFKTVYLYIFIEQFKHKLIVPTPTLKLFQVILRFTRSRSDKKEARS